MIPVKLFYLEDDGNAEEGAESITGGINDKYGQKATEISIISSLADARGLLDDENIEALGYTHFLFDISVPYYKRLLDGKIKTYGENTGFAGLDFIVDYYERNQFFQQKLEEGRVGIFSGHSIEIYMSGDNSRSIVCNQVKYFPKLPGNRNKQYQSIMDWLTIS